ncbi:MAG: malate synthase A [Actinomycetota bacterium]|nr:malate synthase A [Actinomycetota bacterium]
MAGVNGVEVRGPVSGRHAEILTSDALGFLAGLHREFDRTRLRLLEERQRRLARLNAGERLDVRSDTHQVRDGNWTIGSIPDDLHDRRVEITGPTDRKMVINALNSGARVFMADFEDSNVPTWDNMVTGQANLVDAVNRTIDLTNPDGKTYKLNDDIATLLVRPRGWHLEERHVVVDGAPLAGALFDFGLYMWHNGRRLLESGTGPYFYLPKLESHTEARLWNDVFQYAQDALGMDRGTIKATVLIETIPAAFEMDEILYEMKDHIVGLNAGRWDYIFSIIKTFRAQRDLVLPDRAQVTMTVPFMRAYTELLIKTCHNRGAQAMGGMAAFVPSRKNPEVNESAIAKVREDKTREANDGCDGTWVAHPDLVGVATEEFDEVLGDRPNQLDRRRDDVSVTAEELQNFTVPGGTVTEAGVRNNVNVALRYMESWLRGTGAVTIFNLMEDAATAEIARSQIWQWIRNNARLDDGATVDVQLIQTIQEEELDEINKSVGDEAFFGGRYKEAQALFERVCLEETFCEFFTLPGSDYLD